MNRVQLLESKVRALYDAKDPNRADWADWLVAEHVFVVADKAAALAEKYGANQEYSRAAAMLHDIADAKMSRFDESHEEQSLEIARQLLKDSDYTPEEISLIVDDAIKYHSCHDGKTPKSLEGKVLATADSLAHLTSNFYDIAEEKMLNDSSPENFRAWATKKLDRDYYNKILFDEIKQNVQADYERLKLLYSH